MTLPVPVPVFVTVMLGFGGGAPAPGSAMSCVEMISSSYQMLTAGEPGNGVGPPQTVESSQVW